MLEDFYMNVWPVEFHSRYLVKYSESIFLKMQFLLSINEIHNVVWSHGCECAYLQKTWLIYTLGANLENIESQSMQYDI